MISEPRRYQATQIPNRLTEHTQVTSSSSGRFSPDSIASAGIVATRPPEMILAEDDAAVCAISTSPGARRSPICNRASRAQKPDTINSAMIEILKDQPILRPE